MSDNDKLTIVEAIEMAQRQLETLKEKVAAAGDDKITIASVIDTQAENTIDCINWLMYQSRQMAQQTSSDLFSFLDNYTTWPKSMFWSHLHKKLKCLENTSEDFRKGCLSKQMGEGNAALYGSQSKLIHEICKLNPPVHVVKTLLDITPDNDGYNESSRYDYLACDRSYENPLHKVVRAGGSIELVKLLVNADVDKKSLKRSKEGARSSVYHVLTAKASKAKYQPNGYSQVLKYLVLVDNTNDSPLLYDTKPDNKSPIARLYHSLKSEGLSDFDVLRNEDFVFLIKATCHSFLLRKKEVNIPAVDCKLSEINRIPLLQACLVCSTCFNKEVVRKIMECFFSNGGLYWNTKNEYFCPVHKLVLANDWGFFINTITNPHYNYSYKQFMIETILNIAPQCAEQKDHEERLPLHHAADSVRVPIQDKQERLSLVQTIWEAYPDAANDIDKETKLPAFALPSRLEADGNVPKYYDDGTSSTFFLLRQRPEMLAIALGGSTEGVNISVVTRPQTKRPRLSK